MRSIVKGEAQNADKAEVPDTIPGQGRPCGGHLVGTAGQSWVTEARPAGACSNEVPEGRPCPTPYGAGKFKLASYVLLPRRPRP